MDLNTMSRQWSLEKQTYRQSKLAPSSGWGSWQWQPTPDLIPINDTLTIPSDTQYIVQDPTILGTLILFGTLVLI